jgi:PAS domain S-box-containing protein
MTTSDKMERLQRRIDELEKEKAALELTATKYRNIFTSLPVSVQVVDEKGLIVEISPFHVRHIGKGKTTERDYLHQYIFERPSIIRAGLSEKYKRVLEGETFYEKEVLFPVTTGGTGAYHNVRGAPIKNNGKISGAIFIIEDVTELKQARKELQRYYDKLEAEVEARTADLKNAYLDLRRENSERKKTEEEKEKLILELREALKQVKTLRGFLPICASCKKIRDDQGYWQKIESYIRDHSDLEFSHGICPECAKKLYPHIDYPE